MQDNFKGEALHQKRRRKKSRSQRRNSKTRKKKKIIITVSILSTITLALLFSSNIRDFILTDFGVCSTAQITESPQGTGENLVYKYRFQVEGEPYYSSSQVDLKEMDSSKEVCIVYLALLPSINKPLNSFDYEDRNCYCEK